MSWARATIGALGAFVLGYGAWLLLRQARPAPDFLLSQGAWLLAGPLLHDWLVAPVAATVGLLLARHLPRPWSGSVTAGLFTTAVLFLVGVPVLTRPAPAPPNPGLDDRAYLPGLLLFLAVLWALLLAATAAYAYRRAPGLTRGARR